jgi:uncharacterized protein YijF (DUF1287 family)
MRQSVWQGELAARNTPAVTPPEINAQAKGSRGDHAPERQAMRVEEEPPLTSAPPAAIAPEVVVPAPPTASTSAPFSDHADLSIEKERLPPLLAGLDQGKQSICTAGADRAELLWPSGAAPQDDGRAFGERLATAARTQTGELVIYNDVYRRISYPMGDVPELYGVCTDVVVRAYRDVGIDLQALVRRARVGTGDASIDHRRTLVLQRFFARYGRSLPVTDFVEDYRPGDIVTYDRPQNHGSRAHIAIVTDAIAPSGRPMIVHNRGWGPQLEDALFVDRMTGHYRYTGTELRIVSADGARIVAGTPAGLASSSVVRAALAPSESLGARNDTSCAGKDADRICSAP